MSETEPPKGLTDEDRARPAARADRPGVAVSGSRPIWLSLAYIVAVGALASYGQALKVVQAADGHGLLTYAVAALADPTLFAALLNIGDSLRKDQGLPGWSCVSAGVAAVVTISANVYAGYPHAVPSYLVRVWPAVAVILGVESLMSFLRRNHKPEYEGAGNAVAAREAASPREWLDAELVAMLAYESERNVAAAFGVSRPRVAAAAATKAALNGASHE